MGVPVWLPAVLYGGVAGMTGGVAVAATAVGATLLGKRNEPEEDVVIRKGANCTMANIVGYPGCVGCTAGCVASGAAAAVEASAPALVVTTIGAAGGSVAVATILTASTGH
eukprot:TRINITY_DN1066_c0_g1_i1.p1 TRINITY_DN1066_c0_g1~~TRINITY_DN1066_c0_g1_i1.p1  ORF type:complete len:111 (+),score=4.80 TRINITY_DN1066_c0_g1_i1:90-422(+)